MKFLTKRKDGGPESSVIGYWLVEIKKWFSIALLKFTGKSRNAYHSHAFNSWSILIAGDDLVEEYLDGEVKTYKKGFRLIKTPRDRLHKVDSKGISWVLTFRGKWLDKWVEYRPSVNKFFILSNGRAEHESFTVNGLLDTPLFADANVIKRTDALMQTLEKEKLAFKNSIAAEYITYGGSKELLQALQAVYLAMPELSTPSTKRKYFSMLFSNFSTVSSVNEYNELVLRLVRGYLSKIDNFSIAELEDFLNRHETKTWHTPKRFPEYELENSERLALVLMISLYSDEDRKTIRSNLHLYFLIAEYCYKFK